MPIDSHSSEPRLLQRSADRGSAGVSLESSKLLRLRDPSGVALAPAPLQISSVVWPFKGI